MKINHLEILICSQCKATILWISSFFPLHFIFCTMTTLLINPVLTGKQLLMKAFKKDETLDSCYNTKQW